MSYRCLEFQYLCIACGSKELGIEISLLAAPSERTRSTRRNNLDTNLDGACVKSPCRAKQGPMSDNNMQYCTCLSSSIARGACYLFLGGRLNQTKVVLLSCSDSSLLKALGPRSGTKVCKASGIVRHHT
jgi:hypothetical protein